jgi:dihydrodipicolinate synthase/N-acetylneuraminate lyase
MEIAGTGVPLVTPFDETGDLDRDRLRGVVEHVAAHVDFLVPCGSTGEAVHLTDGEHARVVETVVEASDLPVIAGVDGPGLRRALGRARQAAAAGADAVLAVTPYYYGHTATDLAVYYRDLAEESPLPVFCYSVPKFTGVTLESETAAGVAEHDTVVGIKDSSGDVERVGRTARATPDAFTTLVGAGGVYAHALEAGADGGILALANAVPELAGAVYDRHERGEERTARALNADLVALNRAITARHGVPALKAALRERGVPAGHPRRPLGPADDDAVGETLELLEAALERDTRR